MFNFITSRNLSLLVVLKKIMLILVITLIL